MKVREMKCRTIIPANTQSQQRRYNVAATSRRCCDVVTTLLWRCVFAGMSGVKFQRGSNPAPRDPKCRDQILKREVTENMLSFLHTIHFTQPIRHSCQQAQNDYPGLCSPFIHDVVFRDSVSRQ